MKSRVHKIEIRNFKAFDKFTLKLEGRHLLLYGANGSGKSSLYWALYTFMQSARKKKSAVTRYFEPSGTRSLLNIHQDSTKGPGEIKITFRNVGRKRGNTYRISAEEHDTSQKPDILKGDLASDFINHRFFFMFSNFRFSQQFDIWPLFEREILPFCVSTSGVVPLDSWDAIKSGDPNTISGPGIHGSLVYVHYVTRVAEFAEMLSNLIDSINDAAQKFYDEHFASDDSSKVILKLNVTGPKASGAGENFRFDKPIIKLGVRIDGKTVHKPQSFLNEAKMTQLALSVRFAASLVNLRYSDLKLLVLDDLLISLDMSNRMKVVEILLEQFADYQKIIMTHDLGLFREFQRAIGSDHANWCFKKLVGNAKDGISAEEGKTPVQKAEGYLSGHDLEEAAVNLRKAAEDSVRRLKKIMDGKEDPPGKFHSLTDDLRAARNSLRGKIPVTTYEKALKDVPEEHRDKLVRINDDDIDADEYLDKETKRILKRQRRKLAQFLGASGWRYLETMRILDDILDMSDRVLNPASHWGEPQLYEDEIKRALDLIKKFDQHTGTLQKNEQK